MSLGSELSSALKEIESADSKNGRAIEVNDGEWRAKASFRDFDRLAVLSTGIDVWKDVPAQESKSVERKIQAQARKVERKIGYLVEPFKTVEFDRGDKILQMRSTEPLRSKGVRYYYELLLIEGWKASLRRYKTVDEMPGREPVAISLTVDVLERLVDDLAWALSGSSE